MVWAGSSSTLELFQASQGDSKRAQMFNQMSYLERRIQINQVNRCQRADGMDCARGNDPETFVGPQAGSPEKTQQPRQPRVGATDFQPEERFRHFVKYTVG